MLVKARRAAIATAALVYVAGAIAGTAYGSAALYQLFHKMRPQQLHLTTTYRYWKLADGDLPERKKILLAAAIPAAALFFVIPMAIASIGPKRRELHGSARFANRMEVVKSGLLGSRGILLGRYEGGYLMLAGQQSVLLAAPTRSGKGVGVVIPNLLAWPDSVCVVDIKGENFKRSAGFRAEHGQEVYAWAPFGWPPRQDEQDEPNDSADAPAATPEESPVFEGHCYNPLADVRTDPNLVVGDLLAIAQIFFATADHDSGATRFFNDQARSLFLGLALYLVETPELPRTIGELLRQSSGKGKPVPEYLSQLIASRDKEGRPLSDACVDALMRFLSNSEKVLGDILSTFNAPLLIFAEPSVDATTSRSDFSLKNLRRKRMSVYVVVPPNRLADASVLLNLFFSQLINLNTDQLPEDNPALKYQCLLVLDECTAMGRVAVIAKALGYFAGYNLRCLTVVQAGSQIESTYGDKDARTMVTNHAAQIYYAPREQRDAKEYSEMLGTFTERSESKGRSSSTGGRGGGSVSTNVTPQPRALLNPLEFKEIGIDREVVTLENVKPILAEKICYYTDPTFIPRLRPPPELPAIDLDLHRARIERRVRLAAAGEMVPRDRLAANFSKLPALGAAASPEQLADFVTTFFAELAAAPPQPIQAAEAAA
jgi:type IV secretion system protein VirD4